MMIFKSLTAHAAHPDLVFTLCYTTMFYLVCERFSLGLFVLHAVQILVCARGHVALLQALRLSLSYSVVKVCFASVLLHVCVAGHTQHGRASDLPGTRMFCLQVSNTILLFRFFV